MYLCAHLDDWYIPVTDPNMSLFNFGSTSSATASHSQGPADRDIEVAEPPTDSISSLAFSDQADYMAVGSWDNHVSPPS